MTPEFQKLEELAKLATSGEWDIEMSEDSDSFLVTNHEAGFHIAIVPDELAAEYFVAANPKTILSLLSSLREKERENAALTEERDSLKTKLEETQFFLQEEMKKSADWYTAHEEMRDRADDAEEERDRYREEAQRYREALEKSREALKIGVAWMQGNFSDTDFDMDGSLANADAEMFVALDRANKALSLSPLPEREAEREVIAAAEEWEEEFGESVDSFRDYASPDICVSLTDAVRKLRSLREKG